ncbi:uncharacterized protein LOC110361570 [Columba livia]|uniref:uncharacterized protein LOC110361570 n=1 Tax=Columba livia TaxID=8932 RepID=UPI0031B9B942
MPHSALEINYLGCPDFKARWLCVCLWAALAATTVLLVRAIKPPHKWLKPMTQLPRRQRPRVSLLQVLHFNQSFQTHNPRDNDFRVITHAPTQDTELRGSAVYLHAPPCALPLPGLSRSRLNTSRLRPPAGESAGSAAGRTSLRGGQGPAGAAVPTKRGSRHWPCPAALPPLRRANSRRCPAVVFSPRQNGCERGETRAGSGVSTRPSVQRRPAGGAEGEAGTEGTKAAGNKERQAQTGTPEGLRTTTDVQQYVPLPSTVTKANGLQIRVTSPRLSKVFIKGWKWETDEAALPVQSYFRIPASCEISCVTVLPTWVRTAYKSHVFGKSMKQLD